MGGANMVAYFDMECDLRRTCANNLFGGCTLYSVVAKHLELYQQVAHNA